MYLHMYFLSGQVFQILSYLHQTLDRIECKRTYKVLIRLTDDSEFFLFIRHSGYSSGFSVLNLCFRRRRKFFFLF